jgi:hypothetical protein
LENSLINSRSSPELDASTNSGAAKCCLRLTHKLAAGTSNIDANKVALAVTWKRFRAAVNHHAKEGFHRGVVCVSLPPKGEARDRWLPRKEAAALIWEC